MSRYKVIREAEFSPKLADYTMVSSLIGLCLTVIGIPIAAVFFVVGKPLVQKWIDRLGCTLTERTLELQSGIFNRVESTIPLEKITDLQMVQGPIMRAMGIKGFKVETAGQSSGPTGYLMSLKGIVDAEGFREAVLDQRDRMSDGGPRRRRDAGEDDAAGGGAAAELAEIKASVLRIEALLRERGEG